MNWLVEPFSFEFMRNALIAGLLISVTAASLGVFVVLRRMAFVGDALAHASLPGLAGAYLAGFNLIAGALAAALLTAMGIGYFSKDRRVKEDVSIGVLFTAMFAFGVILLSQVKSYRCLSHVIFGNLLAVGTYDLWYTGCLAAAVLFLLFLFFRELELTTCDPGYSRSIGISPEKMRYLLLALLAATVVCGIQASGVVLTSALLVTPAASAALLTDSATRMVGISISIASIATFIGLFASFHLGVSAGASIVLICAGFFVVAWAYRYMWKERLSATRAGDPYA